MDENENVAEATPKPLTEILNSVQDAAPTEKAPAEPVAKATDVEEKGEAKTEPEKEPSAAKTDGETPSLDAETKEGPDKAPDKSTDESSWTRSAVMEERRKRQAIEQELAGIRQQLQQQSDEAAPDIFDDPEGWQKHQDDKLKTIQEASNQGVQEAVLRVSRSHVTKEVGIEALEEAAAAFESEAARTPSLVQDALASDSPYQFIFDTGKAAIERQALGDPHAFAAKAVAEATKKAEAEIQKQVDERVKAALAEHLPKSLADEQTQGDRATVANTWSGPTPLKTILNSRRT
ncbi:MAG: hypothetical protein GY952_06745 [Rhodobacteraceae bacterium]|nr:hypothetical protein [Paracoccaceae bacterium]